MYEKQNFLPGQKLKASQLNHMEEGIAKAVSVTEQSLDETQKEQARNNIGALPVYGSAVAATSIDGASYTATIDGLTELFVGCSLVIVPNKTSTSNNAVTLNVNGLGAKGVKRGDSKATHDYWSGQDADWLRASRPISITYNGTYWIIAGMTRPYASDLIGKVSIANGGTGATTAEEALSNLGGQPKLGYTTPEMYGAIGDGVNDDAGAFTNAINNSDCISLTSDLFLLTPVAISGKPRLVIDGNGYTVHFKNIERALQITGSTNITFRNIVFDGNSCTTQGVLFIDCANIKVEKCTFKNMTTTSATSGDTWGLNFRDSKDMRVDFCSFVNIDGSNNSTKVANGIVVHGHTKPCENVTISNCYFDTILPVNDGCGITFSQTSFYDSPLYGVIENCFFVDCAKRAVKIMAQYVTVNHCNIVDVLSNEQHSALIDIMASHCRVTNNTINANRATNGISCQYVAETTLTGFSDIIIENNYINVKNEDSVTARDGLSIGIVDDPKKYTEVVVKNNIVNGKFRYAFRAMNIADSVIDGNTFEGESRVGNRSLNNKPCDNIRIVNNTIKGSFEASVAHSVLANNDFGGGGFGIYFPTYTNGSPSNLRIIGNRFDNLSYGIDGRRQAMDNIIITENIFTNITTYDMHLLGTNYVVENNISCKGVSGSFEEAYPEKTTTWQLSYEDGSTENIEVIVK